MGRISRFIEYIVESNELSNEDLDDFLISIRDIGIECEVADPVTITEGKYSGRQYRKIEFDIKNLEYMGGLGYADALVDDKIWELFDELITLKNRLGSDKVALTINTMKRIIAISFITNASVKSGESFELERLYRRLNSKAWEGKSDFTNNMTMKLDKENLLLTVNVSLAFTLRKWRLFIRDFDMSNYDVDIKENLIKRYTMDDDNTAVIKITPKK